MAGVDRRVTTSHPVARDEQGPIEAAAVVRDEPGVLRDVGLDQGEQWPARWAGPAGAAAPAGTGRPPTSRAPRGTPSFRPPSRGPSSPCRGRRAGTSGGGWPGQRGPGLPVEGQDDGQSARSGHGIRGRLADDLAVNGLGDRSIARVAVRVRSAARWRRIRPDGGPVVREPPLERRTELSAATTAPAPISWRSRSASALASTSGSSRGPVQAGQPASQPQRCDEVRRRRRSAPRGAARAAPTGRPRPAPPRRGRSVGASWCGERTWVNEAEVARVHHQQHARDRLDRAPGPMSAMSSSFRLQRAGERLRGQPVGGRLELDLRAGRRGPSRRSRP